ncbi:abscisic acid-deficient protein Aba4 family protein [Altericista sp. CCNU0014]
MPTLDWWFTGANVFVLPFWTLAVLLPNWDWTRRLMSSLLPFVALALL